MRREVRLLFASIVDRQCDTCCPAVQNAIDRLAAEWGRGRAHMLGLLRSDSFASYGIDGLSAALLEAWKPGDVLLVTGRTREAWLALGEVTS